MSDKKVYFLAKTTSNEKFDDIIDESIQKLDPLQATNAQFSRLSLAKGSLGDLPLRFIGDTNLGLYSSGDDVLDIVNNGTTRLQITSTVSRHYNSMHNISGTAADPSYSFQGDTTTGMYRIGAGIVGITTGGVERARISSSGLQVGGQTNIQSIVTGYTGTTTVNANSFKSVLVNHPFGSINFVALFTISLVTGSASIQPSYTTKSSTQVEFIVRNYDTTQSTVYYLDYLLLKL